MGVAGSRTLRFELRGGRYLRPLEEADAEQLDRVIEANPGRAYLAEWLPWVETTSGVDVRLDFVEEGVLATGGAPGDGFKDVVVYAMLAADWSRGGPYAPSAGTP